MKKTVLAVGLSIFLVSLSSCSRVAEDNSAAMATPQDTLSYAVGAYMAEGLREVAINSLGVDSSCLDDFIRGVRDAFPLSHDPHAIAYSRGLGIGVSAIDMFERANRLVFPDDSSRRLLPAHFIEGVAASICDDDAPMKKNDAIDYCNSYRYRDENERFMRMNATRDGVHVLPNGLQYKMSRQGDGDVATANDTVVCIYRGMFHNGRTFDSSRGYPVKLSVNRLIPGFAQALQMLPEGSVCKVYVPWELGYGAKGTSRIPPYKALIYDIEVLRVIKNKEVNR